MNLEGVVDDQLLYLHHILDTVPFAPNAMVNGYFLDIYKLTFAEILLLNISEKTWEAYNQVPVNRLLKLSISFGNLIKTFHLEKSHHEARNGAQQNHQNLRKPSRQSVDPFQDTFTDEKAFFRGSVPPQFREKLLSYIEKLRYWLCCGQHSDRRGTSGTKVSNFTEWS
ncbi:hypothetical protein HF325_005406 [Metschnikowia pulcherrima]|uniref:Uncharacterized protein n=1 Tax=Metschnikowia pulcherrima TaxID=27326 RepID=A0A8H7LCW5_9ASCO|nr:hypothetical protein HF325_005406 [Metschnikowia pulcherrima]